MASETGSGCCRINILSLLAQHCTSYWTTRNCVCCKGEEQLQKEVKVDAHYTETQYKCSACPSGTFRNNDWHIALCETCPQGTFHLNGDTGRLDCNVCPLGKYGWLYGAVVNKYPELTLDYICKSCEAGKFSGTDTATARTSCSSCAAGSFSGEIFSRCPIPQFIHFPEKFVVGKHPART